MKTLRFPAVLLLALLLATRPGIADPKKDLKSKDLKTRLAAVDTLRAEGGKDAEKLLIEALGDRDWQVVEMAAAALGERGGEDAVKPLLEQTLAGRVARVRVAAAQSLAILAPKEAGEQLTRRVSGETAIRAIEALEVLAPALGWEQLEEGVKRGFALKEVPVRVAAARLVGAFGGARRREVLAEFLKGPEVSVKAAALDAAIATPDPDDIPLLLDLLHVEVLSNVLERRALAGVVAAVGTAPAAEGRDRLGRKAMMGHELASTGEVAGRIARLAGLLAEAPPLPEVDEDDGDPPQPELSLVDPEVVIPALEFALGHESPLARAAAARALGRIRTDVGLDRAAALAAEDQAPRVRLHALRAVVAARTIQHPGTLRLALERLQEDSDPSVREQAATALGVKGLSEAAEGLIAALADPAWEVAVCAAVSLGKTGTPEGLPALVDLLGARDWKLRGAAIVGLGHLRQVGAVTYLIDALSAVEAPLGHSAYQFLRRMTTLELPPRQKDWKAWWAQNEQGFEFPDREKELRDAKKYGYAPTYQGVYEDLDVIVLQSRGDHIEDLLSKLTVQHRLTRSGQVPSAGVHPFAIFVVNCTGEITPKDVEQLAWFVRVGGYLFGSCWALSETIEDVYPGAVRKLPTLTEVLDNVEARPCPTQSPYLTGVFTEFVRPVYVLYGAHLIEVLDPERVEVLIDSPQCADRFGEGNLACWFDAGHGVILDSVNHFDLQGLERAEGLKTAEDRMAWAMDHMGLGYSDLRDLAAKRIWSSRSKAAKEARDLSAFRFITNFVRHKRRVDR